MVCVTTAVLVPLKEMLVAMVALLGMVPVPALLPVLVGENAISKVQVPLAPTAILEQVSFKRLNWVETDN